MGDATRAESARGFQHQRAISKNKGYTLAAGKVFGVHLSSQRSYIQCCHPPNLQEIDMW